MTVLMTVAMIERQKSEEKNRPLTVAWITPERRDEIFELSDKNFTVKQMADHFEIVESKMYSYLWRSKMLKLAKRLPGKAVGWKKHEKSIRQRLLVESVTSVGMTFGLTRIQMQNIIKKLGISANEQKRIAKAKTELQAA